MNLRISAAAFLLLAAQLAGCAPGQEHTAPDASARSGAEGPGWPDGLHGYLLMIGGGLEDDNRAVYERFIQRARTCAAREHAAKPVILIATAASLDEAAAAKGKTETLRAYCPECEIETIGRETDPRTTIELLERAHGMFFTGGDQKRVTTRYLAAAPVSMLAAKGIEPPMMLHDVKTETGQMRELLARDGVIAGTSAGEAMMSDPMFLTGRSAEALGVRSTRIAPGADDDEDSRGRPPLGPQIGLGMGFAPRIIADSHFFERDRFGRLVAALESAKRRVGVGVGENACAELDLASGSLTGISAAGALVVDIAALERDGLTRRGVWCLVLHQGQQVSLASVLAAPRPSRSAAPSASECLPLSGPGSPRRTASWRFFERASAARSASISLRLDGYEQVAWPASRGGGWIEVEIRPLVTSAAQ